VYFLGDPSEAIAEARQTFRVGGFFLASALYAMIQSLPVGSDDR
jgi:hypothetical protein